MNNTKKVRLTCLALGVYFILLPFDCFKIASVGSLLKVYVAVPIFLILLSGEIRYMMKSQILLSLLLLLLVTGLSPIVSIDLDTSLSSFLSLLMNLSFVILVGTTYRFREEEYEFLKKCLVIGGWITVASMLLFGAYSSDGRLVLSFGDSVQDANYVNGYMMFAFGYHLTELMNGKKLKHLIFAAAIFAVVIFTGSRGALLAYIACIFIVSINTIQSSRYPVRLMLLTIILCIVGYFICTYLMDVLEIPILTRYSLTYLRERGTTGRTKIWRHLWGKYLNANVFRELLGFGYGTTRQLNTLSGPLNGLVAHNLLLDDLISIGILGASIRVSMFLACVRQIIRVKEYFLTCVFGAFIVMASSLSLTNYKPIWAAIIMILILQSIEKQKNCSQEIISDEK